MSQKRDVFAFLDRERHDPDLYPIEVRRKEFREIYKPYEPEEAAAQNAFAECDAMLAVGTRFAEICTGSYGSVPPRQLVHIDINPGALGRNFPAAVPIHADARDAVPALADALDAAIADRDSGSLAAAIAADKAAYRGEWLQHGAGERVNPARFFDALRERLAALELGAYVGWRRWPAHFQLRGFNDVLGRHNGSIGEFSV